MLLMWLCAKTQESVGDNMWSIGAKRGRYVCGRFSATAEKLAAYVYTYTSVSATRRTRRMRDSRYIRRVFPQSRGMSGPTAHRTPEALVNGWCYICAECE